MKRSLTISTLLSVIAVTLTVSLTTQSAQAQEHSNAVADGGIFAEGWNGRIDVQEAEYGATLEDGRLSEEKGVLHVTTGPAVVYWRGEQTASGNYTVMATFTEPKFMSLSSHPHPYGVFIGGNDMGTENQTLLYCEAYGSGAFIFRGFGPAPFRMNGRHGEKNSAVHKAAGKGKPVTQDIALSVKDETIECSINGTVVASHPKSELVGKGKLKSTDGAYGFRFGHNTEGTVSGFHMMK